MRVKNIIVPLVKKPGSLLFCHSSLTVMFLHHDRNAKAKPNPANTFLTPVDLARRMGHTDVVSLLTDDLASTAT